MPGFVWNPDARVHEDFRMPRGIHGMVRDEPSETVTLGRRPREGRFHARPNLTGRNSPDKNKPAPFRPAVSTTRSRKEGRAQEVGSEEVGHEGGTVPVSHCKYTASYSEKWEATAGSDTKVQPNVVNTVKQSRWLLC